MDPTIRHIVPSSMLQGLLVEGYNVIVDGQETELTHIKCLTLILGRLQ